MEGTMGRCDFRCHWSLFPRYTLYWPYLPSSASTGHAVRSRCREVAMHLQTNLRLALITSIRCFSQHDIILNGTCHVPSITVVDREGFWRAPNNRRQKKILIHTVPR